MAFQRTDCRVWSPLPGSNEPLVVQALEEAILFRQWCADGNPDPYRSEDLERIREYRKLLHQARARAIEVRGQKSGVRGRNGNSHPGKVR